MNWQPIETAPKDGTGFLAFWGKDTALDERSFGVVVFVSGEYRNTDDYGTTYGKPTHWMPLPEPPQ